MRTLASYKKQKRTILEVMRSPIVAQKDKERLWATFKFCHMPRWYRKVHRKEYPNLDWEKVNYFEKIEAMGLKKEFR